MKKSILALATLLAIAAGCAQEKLGSRIKIHSGIKEISATIADQTKTYLGNDGGVYKLFWFPEEPILVGAGNEFLTFTLTEGENTPKGKFGSASDLPVANAWYVVSPEMSDVSASNDTLFLTYPAHITYMTESGCAEGGEIMVAKSSSTNFTMHNAIGFIKFQLAVAEEETIEKIEISDKNGADMVGPALIKFNGEKIDEIKFDSAAASTLTVDFTEQVTISTAEPFVTFIPVAPMPNGISITITMKSGKSMTMTSSTPVQIGHMIELPVIDFAPVQVAQVGENKYYSFKQAIEAADEIGTDATVKLIADCNVGADCEISSANDITLDLNGFTLKSVGDNYLSIGRDTKHVIIIDSSEGKTGTITNTNPTSTPFRVYGKTTMKGGNIVSGTNYGVYVQGGWFVMDGGTINSGSTGIYIKPKDDMAIDSVVIKGDSYIHTTSGTGVLINSKNSSLIFRGGEVQAKGCGVYAYDGILKIYDGTFGSKTNVIYAHRSYDNQVDIYGGCFHKDSINAIVWGHTTTDSTRVVGGYYNATLAASYIPSGYSISSCDTIIGGRQYTVTIEKTAEIQATVSINGGTPVEKATINDAFNTAIASGQDALITLVADCAPTDSMVLLSPNKIVVDFNGKTLTCGNDKIFRIVGENSDITFKSSAEGGGINQTSSATGCMAIRQRGGKVTIESGTYGGTGTQYTFYTTGGEFHMNGGTAYADSNVIWVSRAKFYMNGGKFIHRETSTKETVKQIYITTEGEGIFNGGEFESVYVYNSDTKATFIGGNYPTFTLGGGCKEVYIEDGTFQNIHFSPSGTITVKGGTFNDRSYMEGTGTLNIEGGTFTNTGGYAFYPTAGTINIKNATFNGNSEYSTLRGIKCIINIGEGTVVNNSHSKGNAIYCGSEDYKCTMTVTGGTFNAPKGFYAADGSLSVSGGTFNGCSLRAGYVTKGNTSTEITGGYFNASADSAIFEGSPTGILKGGWFNKVVTEAAIDPSYILDNSKSTVVEGVTYNYHVVENSSSPDIATVNGTAYKSIAAAIQATTKYSGSDNEVVIKLVSEEDTVTLNTTADFTNVNGKPVKFDFNNHVLKGTVDSLIVTKGVLTLTDESAEKGGVLATAKRRVIAINEEGTVNIKRIKIDGTRGGMGYSSAMYSMITVTGTSSANKAVLNISDGARLLAKNHYIKFIYVYYGTLTTENCEIITKHNSTSSSVSYPCIWAYSGANITIKSGTYLQAGTPTARGALYIATGNVDAGSTITVEDGAMLYCEGENGAIGSDSASDTPDVPYCSKTLHLKGGYLNKYSKAYLQYPAIYDGGKSIQEITPAKEYTNCLGETRTMGYQVK